MEMDAKRRAMIIRIAEYYIDNESTLRETAYVFDLSKSTIHVYLHKYLRDISTGLYMKYVEISQRNYREKHIRGGQATARKYIGGKNK